jgi:hypothetical protein
MVGRYEISDNGWAQIKDIVAPPQTMGRPRRDDRKMLNGIFWMLCSGAICTVEPGLDYPGGSINPNIGNGMR